MAEEKKPVTFDEILLSNMYEIEAIITILERKGILTHDEVLEVIKEIKAEHDKKIN